MTSQALLARFCPAYRHSLVYHSTMNSQHLQLDPQTISDMTFKVSDNDQLKNSNLFTVLQLADVFSRNNALQVTVIIVQYFYFAFVVKQKSTLKS